MKGWLSPLLSMRFCSLSSQYSHPFRASRIPVLFPQAKHASICTLPIMKHHYTSLFLHRASSHLHPTPSKFTYPSPPRIREETSSIIQLLPLHLSSGAGVKILITAQTPPHDSFLRTHSARATFESHTHTHARHHCRWSAVKVRHACRSEYSQLVPLKVRVSSSQTCCGEGKAVPAIAIS